MQIVRETLINENTLINAAPYDVLRLGRYLNVDALAIDYADLIMIVALATELEPQGVMRDHTHT